MTRKKKEMTADEGYTAFMEAVRRAEEVEAGDSFSEALEAVEETWDFVEDHQEEYSSAEMRRARRSYGYITDMAAIKKYKA